MTNIGLSIVSDEMAKRSNRMLAVIQKAFADSGLPILAVARATGLAYATVYDALHGNVNTRFSTIDAIADALDLEMVPRTRKNRKVTDG